MASPRPVPPLLRARSPATLPVAVQRELGVPRIAASEARVAVLEREAHAVQRILAARHGAARRELLALVVLAGLNDGEQVLASVPVAAKAVAARQSQATTCRASPCS